MHISKLMLAALAMTVALLATGCGGGGAKVEAQTTTTTTTMGQELMDLDSAYQKGIIDAKQYEASKQAILERYKQ